MIQLLLCLTSLWGANDSLAQARQLGPVSVITELAPRKPTIGDEMVLEIRVEAEAGVEVLMPEFGEALSRYTIVDYVPRQRVESDGSTTHIQRYTLQPYRSGDQSIPPILVEFVDRRPGKKPSPDDLDAYEVLTERIDFHVTSVLPDRASAELNPPMGKLDLAQRGETARSVLLAALIIAAVLASLAGIVWWRARRRRVIRRNAYEIARARLDWLLQAATPRGASDMEAFYIEISSIIRRYLEDRFELRAPELTTEEFLAVAGNSGALSREHQRLLRDFLRQADLVKFAGRQANEEEIRESTEAAVRFLEETRENAPWIEQSDTAMPSGSQSGPAAPAATASSSTPVEEGRGV